MLRSSISSRSVTASFGVVLLTWLQALPAAADAVTDWNAITVSATKGFDGTGGAGVALNSNLGSRVEAIEARAVYDAVNAIDRFSASSYYYDAAQAGSAAAAAAQAAHDVILALLPDPASAASVDARWAGPRAWVDAQLSASFRALQLAANDGDIATGKAAAAAAVAARQLDNATPGASYGATLTPSSNPGVGLWRQSNAGAGFVNPATGAPTGFDAAGTAIQGAPGIDLNWRDVTPFSLSTPQKVGLVANVPLSPLVGSAEYGRELEFVRVHGQDNAPDNARSADQTAQALYYKQDAEIFVNELARIASSARGLSLDDNAKLFALLDSAVADARIAAFTSKYEQKFWRPITALNAGPSGIVSNGYLAWHPLAATPSHPSNTAGHSTTGAAGAEVLRAFFNSDRIVTNGNAVTLGSLAWLTGTNSGTGNVTTRSVSTFTQVQLENGASRLLLGVHFGFDNLQGQLLGLLVADTILRSNDPAAKGLRPKDSPASFQNLVRTLLANPNSYGYFGRDTGNPPLR